VRDGRLDPPQGAGPPFRAFAQREIAPFAAASDATGNLAAAAADALRREGFLGAPVSPENGGLGMSAVDYGLLTAEVGRACASARTLLTVHNLVALTLQRWAGAALRRTLLRDLASGRKLAAIALSEPAAGSDIQAIEATAALEGGAYRLRGRKAWTSFGLTADWLLVFAQSDQGSVALMASSDTPGLSRHPITNMSGIRGGAMADLQFDDCLVPRENLVGRPGFGLSHVAATALDHGRYSVAWGAVGLADACLDTAWDYLRGRRQFGERMADLPLAQAALSRMFVDARAARQLCLSAGRLRDERSADALVETLAAKYFSAGVAVRAANANARLRGARGLTASDPAQRLLRDAKVLEVIEGGVELHELLIARQLTSEMVHA
jgi:hypothetical protein